MSTQERGTKKDLEITKRIDFGKTGFKVTPLCIGAAPLGNMPDAFGFTVSEEDAAKTIKHAFSSPFNFMDTAPEYEESEKRIGNVLREIGGIPKGYVLATKADRNFQTGDFSAEQVRKSVELSRERLGLETLQLVYLHDPEHSTYSYDQIMGRRGPVDELLELKKQGIIHHIGISAGPIDLLSRFVEESDVFEAVITHNRYNLLYRTADPLLTLASEKGIAVVNAAPFASGIFARGSEEYPRFTYQVASFEILGRVKQIEEVCRKYNVSLRAAALQFSLRDSRITTTIAGMTSPEQIDQAISDSQVVVPQELWNELDQLAIYEGDPER